MSVATRALTLFLAATTAGCAPLPDDRQAFLVDQLVLDNLRWMSRDPGLLRAKYRRMAADPYDFMRATATVGLVDWTRPGGDRDPTDFLTIRGTESVLLAGDPHPENVGVHRPSGDTLLLEVNDLDGAGFGPYLWDVRRGMLGLAVLLDEAGCRGACAETALSRYAGDYASTVLDGGVAVHSGYGPTTTAPAVVADLLEKVRVEGPARTLFTTETEVVGGERRLVVDRSIDSFDRGDLALTADERAQVARLASKVPVRVLDSARRYGRGVASLPAVRYILLVDDGDPGPDDDRLLQMREVIDPLPFPGWRADLDGSFENNAQRVVWASRELWSRPDADPVLQARPDGAMAFKVTSLSSWFEGFEHLPLIERVEDGRFDDADLADWGGWLGAQLATVHLRAPTREGAPASAAIAADLDGRVEAFVEERVTDTERSLAGLRRDHSLFVGALARLGPDLGAR
ncbi:MAG: DUF2252 family protein [Myxococcota bacterium]